MKQRLITHKHTLFGVAAILLWGSLMGLTRRVAEEFSPIGGAALIYSVSTLFLLVTMGIPRLKSNSTRYVLIGGALFVSYEICLALALGMANDRLQAIEMSVINYLWPALTVLIAVLLSQRSVSVWVYPSVALAFVGVAWTIVADQGISVADLSSRIATNPTVYTMAFIGAFIWAIYCNVTQRLAQGQNAIVLFFGATAATLWLQYAVSNEPALEFSWSNVTILLFAGVVMGSGYALWNVAILRGNMLLLATLSYFTPVISTLFSSMILGVVLGLSFWQGVVMVTLGSLICWWVTREPSASKENQASDPVSNQ
ncbi:aromatic amino acid DMT transporter YddG [Vibrio metoecus]|uniref:EamA family transporter n=1 Tax=Vibrio metoecus TaxID=1481663 RepID=A0A271VP55_VIBMT|nr:aromatic amino acid DMT transporter YddG [Vibrio metoecus]KQB08346.1 aromatic amino acid exporter [Vibrio metoecus]PAR19952.1 EamA family transporter [Vibrio metoecus]PAR23397.1 EamA family transporter [Vibrio metoecus]